MAELVSKLPWPKNAKSIFTSNSYAGDDIFKIWAAGKIEKNIPLIIGQHGGHFGIDKFCFHEDHCVKISDKFISWGWEDISTPKITPIGIFKSLGQNVGYKKNGNALLTLTAVPRYSYHIYSGPISGQYLDYFEDQKRFLVTLPNAIRKKITVRIDHNDYSREQNLRWDGLFPDIKIDVGEKLFQNVVENSRLCISSFNSTTYLETLSWNVPTIVFWDPGHHDLKDEVKEYFDLLNSVGIFFTKPEYAAQQMVNIWDNVGSWWESKDVQDARKEFCHIFARIINDPMAELSRNLNK